MGDSNFLDSSKRNESVDVANMGNNEKKQWLLSNSKELCIEEEKEEEKEEEDNLSDSQCH